MRVSDGRGRHTTVARELIQMPRGGVLIDTPGLRALGLTGSEEGIASVFPDIEQAARSCRFRDCTHDDEPGCAVRAAVESGALPPERLASYHKLLREAQVAAAKTDARLRAAEDRKSKTHQQGRQGLPQAHRPGLMPAGAEGAVVLLSGRRPEGPRGARTNARRRRRRRSLF